MLLTSLVRARLADQQRVVKVRSLRRDFNGQAIAIAATHVGCRGRTPGIRLTPPGPLTAQTPARATTQDFREAGAAALPDAVSPLLSTESVTEPPAMARLRVPVAVGDGKENLLLRGGS